MGGRFDICLTVDRALQHRPELPGRDTNLPCHLTENLIGNVADSPGHHRLGDVLALICQPELLVVRALRLFEAKLARQLSSYESSLLGHGG